MENPPMSEVERLLGVLRITLQGVHDLIEDPETSVSEARAAVFASELAVADAMLGRTR